MRRMMFLVSSGNVKKSSMVELYNKHEGSRDRLGMGGSQVIRDIKAVV